MAKVNWKGGILKEPIKVEEKENVALYLECGKITHRIYQLDIEKKELNLKLKDIHEKIGYEK